jgi:uncharacterized protein (TIGR02598 family)
MRKRSRASFSLVEVTLALGIAAFCLIAVFGLMPVGIQINRNATSQTDATNILVSVVSDLRATSKTANSGNGPSPQFGITFGTNKTLYFNGTGQFTTSLSTDSRYQLDVTWSNSGFSGALRYADLKVTWPAAATAANVSGSTEMFAAFDRN